MSPYGIPDDGYQLLDWINAGHCPDCDWRGFVLGPKGGEAQNIECGNVECRARFNVTVYAGKVLLAQRIERREEGGPEWPSEPKQPASD